MMRNAKLKNSQGFSLVEMMIVVLIIVAVIAGGYTILSSGESAWFTTDTNIQLTENLRKVIGKVSRELKESGSVGATSYVTITDGGGVGATDSIRFSMPIICEAGGSVINNTGNVANWGAPLTWGCTDSTCMDADNDCLSRDYEEVEYRINASNQLVRRVLDDQDPANLVREDIFAQDITDLQITQAGNVVTLVITAQKTSNLNRVISATRSAEVLLRNVST